MFYNYVSSYLKKKVMYRKNILVLLILMVTYSFSYSQEKMLYKQIDSTKLFMDVYYPKTMEVTKKYPAMVFFFGGGWNIGSVKQFEPFAKYFSQRGIICFLVDYRVKNRQQTTPFESLKDAKSAIRFIRANANELQIETSKIIASGGSAGGHLAAASALIDEYNEDTDNLNISCVPNALVLFNPVVDNGPGGYGFERIGIDYKSFSPLHNIKKGAPSTIMFLGTKDKLIPVETVKYYKMVMEKVESRCDLKLYEGEGHGFFNYGNIENYKKIVFETDEFLKSLGYLKNEPIIVIE